MESIVNAGASVEPARLLTQSYWPATRDGELLDSTCGGALREAARIAPDHIALKSGEREPDKRRHWTYSQLLTAAERVATSLLQRFGPRTHITVWSANCPEWVIVQFGIALAGMITVTANPSYKAQELAYVLRQSRSKGVFHQTAYRGVVMEAAIAQACALENIQLEMIVNLDDLQRFASMANDAATLPQVKSLDHAMIQYTSGTTGKPKGVLLSHHSITNTSRIMAEIKLQDGNTINLAVAPLFHTGGCVANILASVQTKGTVVLMESFDAELLLDLIEQERATYTFGVPTMLIAMLKAQDERARDLSSLQMVFSGGAVVPVDLVRSVEGKFGVRLIIGYGLTECSPAITHTRPNDSLEDKSETIGRALPLIEVKIIDPVSGAIQPTGVPGELCARGFNVMVGYFDMPAATAETIDVDGWLHTGDLCAMDVRGYCRVTGRLKDVIIRGGENIYPREIEEALYDIAAISAAAVFAVPDEYWGEQIACVVSFRPAQRLSGDELAELMAVRLARHKVPKHWFDLDEFPLTASGKVQKFRLTELFRSGELEARRI
jgi:fatty-acyl-CoA synthase